MQISGPGSPLPPSASPSSPTPVEPGPIRDIVDKIGSAVGRTVERVTHRLHHGEPFVAGRDGFVAFDSKTGTVSGGQSPGAEVRAARDLPARFAELAEIIGSGLEGIPVQFSVGGRSMCATSDRDGAASLDPDALQPTLSALDPKRGGMVKVGVGAGESGTAQVNVLALPQDYDGPIFVSDIDKTLRWTSDADLIEGTVQPPIYGIPPLFGGVAALGVPIVYLSAGPSRIHPMNQDFLKQLPPGILLDRPHTTWRDLSPSDHTQAVRQGAFKAGVLEEVRKAYPRAQIFGIGDDQYGDAMAYQAVGATAYIHNVQPDQANIPGAFAGVISDCYTPQFQARVLGDLKAAMAQSVSCGGNPGTPVSAPAAEPSPPSMTSASRLHRLEETLSLLRGAPTSFLHHTLAAVAPARVALHHCAGISDAELANMNTADLGKLAHLLLGGIGLASTRVACGDQFMRVLTSQGQDAGHTSAILSHVPPETRPEETLAGAPLVHYMALRLGQRPTPGDWAGLEPFLDTATSTHSRPGSAIQPMLDGAVFPAVLDAIDQARNSVNLCVPAVKSDQAGWQFARHLADAAGRGCAVRLVYDPLASATSNFAPTDPAIYTYLKSNNVDVVGLSPGPLGHHPTHRSVIVVDGTTGFAGSMSLGDEDRDVSHNCECRVQGPAVADLQRLFVDQYKRGGSLSGADEAALFPVLSPAPGAGSARVIGHQGHADQAQKVALLRAIGTAAQSINLAVPALTDEDVINHLAMASQRGVKVQIVLPSSSKVTAARFHSLLNAGANIYTYHGRPASDLRVATFDGQVAVVGSSAPTQTSLWDNDEADLWCTDRTQAQSLDRDVFAADLQQSHPLQFAKHP